MKKLRINKSGTPLQQDKELFGGDYTMREKLGLSGTGSNKFVYNGGIKEFDKLKRGVEGEVFIVNFELRRSGLIVMLNMNQRLSCVGIFLDEIREINLLAYRIDIRVKRFWGWKNKIVHRGELEIKTLDAIAAFSVPVVQFKSCLSFYRKEPLQEKLHHSVSLDIPETDVGHVTSLLSTFT